jgi:putative N6-adenine-specific DNA methylase
MARRAPDNHYFATTSMGLERVLAGELKRLGARGVRPGGGGVSFRGDRALMMAACVSLRTAHRVLWMLGEFPCPTLDALYDGVRDVARWTGLMGPEHTLAVHATTRESAIGDTRILAMKTKDAIVDAIRDSVGTRPSVDRRDPDVRIHLRLSRDRAFIGLDAAGESLHVRGYRLEAGVAPLRETLAAGMLALLGWDGSSTLVDAFCGSGTLPIEAALIAGRRDPGLLGRRYGFERWPGHKPERLEALLDEAEARVRPSSFSIRGYDTSAAAVAKGWANVERAQVQSRVTLTKADARQLRAPDGAPGLLVGNPPYGERMGDAASLVPLYEELGRTLRRSFRGWRVGMLFADERHHAAMGLECKRTWRLRQGPLDITLYEYAV